MKTTIYKGFSLSALIIVALAALAFGQTPEVEQAKAQVNKVLEDSGRHFRDGLSAYKANQRSESGAKFDKSVEIFLYSTLNIQKDQKLQSCYSQLIETIYLMEFPSEAKPPQLRMLSASCGWRWNDEDFKLADEVSAMMKPAAKKNESAILASAAGKSGGASSEAIVGFISREFEPSPLDELSKLELTTDEQQIDSPIAQAQYQYIQYAVANK